MDLSSYADATGEHVFYVTPDGHVHQLYYDNHSWADQDLTGGAIHDPPETSAVPLAWPQSALSSFADASGEHVFYLSADEHVHQLYYDHHNWHDQDLTGAVDGPRPYVAGTVPSFFDAAGEHVFYVNLHWNVHQLHYDNQNWADQDVTRAAGGPPTMHGTQLASFADAAGEHVFYQAANAHIHQLWYDNQNWADQDLTGIAIYDPPATSAGHVPGWPTSSFADAAGEHVCYVSSSPYAHVCQLYYDHHNWHAQDLTGAVGGPTALSGSPLSSFADFAGEHIFYLTPDQHVHHLNYSGGWFDDDLTVTTGSPLAVQGGGLSSLSTPEAGHVFYMASDQHIHQLYYDFYHNNNLNWQDQDLTALAG